MRLVIMESPYAGATGEDILGNLAFGRACLKDCLVRGEAPLATHLLYTQEGVLDDRDAADRALGIEAGHAWVKQASAMVVYVDHGVSEGMRKGITRAVQSGCPVIFRYLQKSARLAEIRGLVQALVDAYPEAAIYEDKTRVPPTKASILRHAANDQGTHPKQTGNAGKSGAK